MKKFEQLKRLYHTISGYIDQYNIQNQVISGTTADFDRLFELTWKTLKEYMQKGLGMTAAKTGSPREILKLAYQQGILQEEAVWLEMLDYRNDDAHHYRKSDAIIYVSKIQDKYLERIGDLIEYLQRVIPEEVSVEIEMPEDFLGYCREKHLNVASFLESLKVRYGYSEEEIYSNWNQIKAELDE